MNYAAWLLRQLNDPALSTSKYMRLWQEYQDLVHRQACIDEEARKRQLVSRIEPAPVLCTPPRY